MKIIKRIMLFLMMACLLLATFVIGSNAWVVKSTEKQIYDNIEEVPYNDVALVLGANPMFGSRENLYFAYRINAAAELYKAGKVKHLIVSGDNHKHNYNEPEEMQKALMTEGVPESAITMDFAGFRTLDSIVRSKKIFQQNKITVLSQKFHNHRAIFIAKRYGLDAVAYNAKDPHLNVRSNTDIREYLARCKAVLDLYILLKQPKFLGEKITINI